MQQGRDYSAGVESTGEPFQIRGGNFTLIVLKIIDMTDPEFYPSLMNKVAQAPSFFRNAPVVVDIGMLDDSTRINFAELGRRLRQHQLVPVGVQNGTDGLNQQAINAGLAVLSGGREASGGSQADRPVAADREPQSSSGDVAADAVPAGERQAQTSRIVTEPVRSGQQIYVPGGDLIVLASVSPGAELLADGNIHIYGALRGRALAGLTGDPGARVFCRSLQAELVSVAGCYIINEDIDPAFLREPVQIRLDGDQLKLEKLT